ncbi:MAG: immunoglobulin domain-containing protein [Paludibacteraceae bacterium]|nr:immunoglobulin domain-containing protein [Paludibacteraceae bacterium]
MRTFLITIVTFAIALSASAEGELWLAPSLPMDDEESGSVLQAPMREDMTMGCPSFPGIMYSSMSYNVGAIPWRLEWTSANFGDLTGATIQWYRYNSRAGESKSQAVPYNGPGSNTIDECLPATDEANSWYDYFCRITKPGCSTIESGIFDVQVGINDPCMTFVGTTFKMTSGDQKYNVGQSFTLSAKTTAYGGDHQYTWYHNGEPIDTTDHTKYTLTWDFNAPTLRVNNATLQDGGTYSISMQDGTECFMYTDPVRITIGNVTCGTTPSISAQKTGLGEGETTKISVSNATLAADETGEFVFMLKPEGSNPTITGTLPNMTFTPDMAGTYNIKYVINNSTNASCFRESKVISIVVYACGPEPTITPDRDIIAYSQTVNCTTTGLGDFETGKVTYQKKGESGWTNTWPEGSATIYNEGEYTFKYEITNSKAPGCNRSATTTVRVYHCGWGAPQWGVWTDSKYKVGASITPTPSELPSENWDYKYFYTIDGGTDTTWLANRNSTITFDTPGKYKIEWKISHKWTNECDKTLTKTITVEPCGTKATIKSNKSSMKVGENATLTIAKAASGETATLTYSKNGGGAQSQTFSGTTSTFTPTSAGTYVFTYTITVPGCGPNSATTTIEVYDCGPDATISAPTDVEVNKSITITVSNVGDHETGVLTYSKDGGAAQTITNPASWTPSAVGTYKLKWTVTHDKIDCTRSAETTVNVYGCGVPADIQTNKTTLKIGESATFTLSAVSNVETSKITYSKDGGSSVDFSGTTFTPSEAGVYVFTYTVSHTKITCETSDQVTITVYGCGPDAEITTAKSTYNSTETVNIQLSALGANESGTLTYSLDGGAPVTITNPTAWNPPSLGSYVLKWSITHQYIDCSREATKTIKVSDCGEPADIEASKTVLRLGESATLTLSAVTEEGATGAVTMAKDGGTPAPFEGMTFVPTATGQYTFRYVISNAILGCETEDQVTIGVYDCGPEATLEVLQTDVKLGNAITITPSAVGDYETGTLTYSLNGGAQQVISSGSWTAPQVGTYVFNWSVTHSKIDCSRQATPVTVQVYDCGVPAAITPSATVLKENETATLTLSPVSKVETFTLTLSENGAPAVPFTGTSFTPTAAGIYTFTYTVTHTKIACETSATATIEVYGCGPEAEISVSATEVKLLRTATIMVSDVDPNHETGVLTYSLDGGSPVTIAPGVWKAEQLGTYVFTWTVTHDKIDCRRSASFTVNVIEAELIFDDKNGTHVWSDVKNWWPSYKRLPHYKDSAIVQQPCQVDIADAQTGDLTFDLKSAGIPLTIRPTGALTINHLLMNYNPGDIIVRADATGNGALVLWEENVNIPATVEFYARSKDVQLLQTVWQYMGYPLNDSPLISNAYPAASMYEWTNTPNRKLGGNWQRVDSLAGVVKPFSGYCMTEDKEKTYTFSGTLNDPVLTTVDVPYNDMGTYPGFAFIANSWVAPIDIARLDVADFGAADATVYIMNTGTYFEAVDQQVNMSRSGTASARGQYNAIPVHAASYLAGSLKSIPPMQGFFVHTNQTTQLKLDYQKSVFDAVGHRSTVEPTRAPARKAASDIEPVVCHLRVSGFGQEDEVYLLVSDRFTKQFDNAWDGRKAHSELSDVCMSVQSQNDELAVAALPELEGTMVNFVGGNHKTYTITIDCPNEVDMQNLYLWNMSKDTYTPLMNGEQCVFKCSALPESFQIVRKGEQIEEQEEPIEKFIYRETLYIRRGNQLYNACGQKLR